MAKAIIFDMDGVLVDSEPLHFASQKHVLSYKGITFTREIHREFIGFSNERAFWQALNKRYNVSLNIDVLMAERDDYFYSHLHQIKVIRPAFDLLQFCLLREVPCGLATSSSRKLINAMMHQFGIDHFFKVKKSGDEVVNGKPAPDIYLEAAADMGFEPADCVVIEDSSAGVAAGKAAGMQVVAVPNEYTRELDFSQADFVLESLTKFPALGLLEALK
ncbi:MAG: HAD family phosphatase [Spirochaetales bacterium]|nr:HAD family phosphatase [Spirochaetales bacterium]